MSDLAFYVVAFLLCGVSILTGVWVSQRNERIKREKREARSLATMIESGLTPIATQEELCKGTDTEVLITPMFLSKLMRDFEEERLASYKESLGRLPKTE